MAGRNWDLAPSEIWNMTLAELYVELEMRGTGRTYANGMTEQDIDNIKTASAELREWKAKRRDTQTA